MKTKQIKQIAAALLLLSTLNPQLSTVFAQGSLSPPGAPAPTMKTLEQIEPRTPISSLPYNISKSGSYYLTTNLVGVAGTNGITINANHVTIDLNGFSLIGVPGSAFGIIASHVLGNSDTGIAVFNGTVRNWGQDGIRLLGPNARVQQVHCRSNNWSGISVGDAALIKECTTYKEYTGISAGKGCIIEQCTVSDHYFSGIYVVRGGSIVRSCIAVNTQGGTSLDGVGIFLEGGVGSVISENSCYSNSTRGILVMGSGGNVLRNNNCSYNGSSSAGIEIWSPGNLLRGPNRIEDNHVTYNGIGIYCSDNATNNMVFRNTARGNTVTNYSGFTGNDFGPIGTAATATSPWSNISN